MILRRALAAGLVVIVVVATGGCGSSNKSKTTAPSGTPGAGKPAVTIGDKNFPEEFTLGQLYAQGLRVVSKAQNLTLDAFGVPELDAAFLSNANE